MPTFDGDDFGLTVLGFGRFLHRLNPKFTEEQCILGAKNMTKKWIPEIKEVPNDFCVPSDLIIDYYEQAWAAKATFNMKKFENAGFVLKRPSQERTGVTLEIVKELIQNGADVHEQIAREWWQCREPRPPETLYEFAVYAWNDQMLELLREAGAQTNEEMNVIPISQPEIQKHQKRVCNLWKQRYKDAGSGNAPLWLQERYTLTVRNKNFTIEPRILERERKLKLGVHPEELYLPEGCMG